VHRGESSKWFFVIVNITVLNRVMILSGTLGHTLSVGLLSLVEGQVRSLGVVTGGGHVREWWNLCIQPIFLHGWVYAFFHSVIFQKTLF
jgi:hypothetical protein